MNSSEKYTYKKCSICNKHLVLTTETYDKDKEEYVVIRPPICGDCKLRLEISKDNKDD